MQMLRVSQCMAFTDLQVALLTAAERELSYGVTSNSLMPRSGGEYFYLDINEIRVVKSTPTILVADCRQRHLQVRLIVAHAPNSNYYQTDPRYLDKCHDDLIDQHEGDLPVILMIDLNARHYYLYDEAFENTPF